MIEKIYNMFYKKPKFVEEERRVNKNVKELKRNFSNHQRKLFLQIIDDKNLISENNSVDGFAQGFKLGCKLTTEIYINNDQFLYDD